MPNHVTNRVWFTGDPVDVWAALRSFTDDEGYVDFERVLPMPEELRGDAYLAPPGSPRGACGV